jgi:hypothetical protein
MRRRRSLITSPLQWQMTAAPVPHPVIPVFAERGGTQLRTPRPVLVVDTREQNPFNFSRFKGWFAGIETRALKLGDYSIVGLEDSCVVERKDLPDLVHSFTAERRVFVQRLRLMSQCPHRLLVIPAALSQVKSLHPHAGGSPESRDAVSDCSTGRFTGSLPVHGDPRTGRRNGRLVPLPSSPVSLAGSQRLRPIPSR